MTAAQPTGFDNDKGAAHFTPVRAADGAIIGAHMVGLEIGGRVRADVAMRESETRLRAFLDTSPAFIWHNDPEGRNLFSNRCFRDLTGAGKGAIKGSKWRLLVHPAREERQAFLLKLSDALRRIADPVEVQATAARLIGNQFGVDRANYYEVDPDGCARVMRCPGPCRVSCALDAALPVADDEREPIEPKRISPTEPGSGINAQARPSALCLSPADRARPRIPAMSSPCQQA